MINIIRYNQRLWKPNKYFMPYCTHHSFRMEYAHEIIL